MNYSNHPATKEYRQLLRKTETPMERKLWHYQKEQQLDGYKFRQQHGFGPYVLDFYCPRLRLCIELDGGIHEDPQVKLKDEIRTEFLNENRIKVIRFSNEEVEKNINSVLNIIRAFIINECKE